MHHFKERKREIERIPMRKKEVSFERDIVRVNETDMRKKERFHLRKM